MQASNILDRVDLGFTAGVQLDDVHFGLYDIDTTIEGSFDLWEARFSVSTEVTVSSP